jgi:outer membrane protein OmpA-like peptidoglycan-associated protein
MKSLEMGRCGSVVLMLALVLTLSGCATNMPTEAAVGGAAVGAVIGEIASGSARGAIIDGVMDTRAEDLQDKVPNARVERIGEGIRVTFNSGVLFDLGQSILRTAAQQNLRELAKSLEHYEGTNVPVFGHTDSTGGVELNQSLSEGRADAARTFLLGADLENDRFSTVGRGEQDPVDKNETGAAREATRRGSIAIYAGEDMQAEMMRRHGGT